MERDAHAPSAVRWELLAPYTARASTHPQCVSFLTPDQIRALDPAGVGVNQALLDFINARYPLPNDLTAGNGINTGATPVPLDANAHVATVVGTATALTVTQNEITNAITGRADDTATFSGGWMFTYDPRTDAVYGSHLVFGFGVAKTSASAAQSKALRYSAYARFDIRPQVLDQVFALGDSRTNVIHPLTRPFDSLALRLASQLGKDFRVYGYGLYGNNCAQLLANVVPTAVAQFNPSARNVATFLCGVNDASQGQTPEQVIAGQKACTAPLKNAGFKVVLLNELATTATTAGVNAKLPVIRSLIEAEGAKGMNADLILDALKITPLNTPANVAVYPDGLHLSHAPTSALASLVVGAVR